MVVVVTDIRLGSLRNIFQRNATWKPLMACLPKKETIEKDGKKAASE
jgi:hypothetical protein